MNFSTTLHGNLWITIMMQNPDAKKQIQGIQKFFQIICDHLKGPFGE
jgi:type IV secretory pathway VirB2 component (pilin)